MSATVCVNLLTYHLMDNLYSCHHSSLHLCSLLMYFLLLLNSSGNRNCLHTSSKGLEPSFGLGACGGGIRGFSLSAISSLLPQAQVALRHFLGKVKMSQNFQAKLNLFPSSKIFFSHHCYFRCISFSEYPFPV